MSRKTLVPVALAVLVVLLAPTLARADSSCGGLNQWACTSWSWCAFTVWGWCVPGFVWPAGSYAGCDHNRLNNTFGICTHCGSNWGPLCLSGIPCDQGDPNLNQARHIPAGLCVPCGQLGQGICWYEPVCNRGLRNHDLFCSQYGYSEEPDCDCTVATIAELEQSTTSVRGWANIHEHMFANLAYGGATFWGEPFHTGGINEALGWCDYTWKFPVTRGITLPHNTRGYAIHGDWWQYEIAGFTALMAGENFHWPAGTGPFDGWPTWRTQTHQQMYYRWLERAYKGGMRLMVTHAVHNEVLCGISPRRTGFNCDDMWTVDLQLGAVKKLQSFIDAEHGGPGKGWFRIATSPSQARDIIRSGKLAVILGIEVDNLFGCGLKAPPCTPAVVQQRLDYYVGQGVRHFYIAHAFDNQFSGAGLYSQPFAYANLLNTGDQFHSWNCSNLDFTFKIAPDPLSELLYGSLSTLITGAGYEQPGGAECNARGLSDLGEFLITEMMDHGVIVDVDHLPWLSMERLLEMAEARDYPLVSGHPTLGAFLGEPGGEAELSEYTHTPYHLERIRNLGGIVAVNLPRGKCSSTHDLVPMFRKTKELMTGGPLGENRYGPEHPGIALVTDMGGFVQQTGPRFRVYPHPYGVPLPPFPNHLVGALKELFGQEEPCEPWVPGEPLQYPFEGLDGHGDFSKQQTGGRTFDFNFDGLAHIGLLPDLLADLKVVGLSEEELDPIFNSAETYIRMWERIHDGGLVDPPSITAHVTGTQGADGWYTSDVEVTWEIVAQAEVISQTGCEPTLITEDTTGLELTCRAATVGGSSEASVTVKRDTLPPVVTSAERITPEPPSGWTNAAVLVQFEAVDATSGLAGASPVDVVVYAEGNALVAQHQFVDRAGLTATAELGGIRIDLRPPQLGFRFASLPPDASPEQIDAEQQRWHNEHVVLEVLASDDLSGVATVSPEQLVLWAEGAAVSADATATDQAGNSATVSAPPVKIDMTPPTIELASRLPAPNAHGWNNTDITVSWTCSDALSGVEYTSVAQMLTLEGMNQGLTGRCKDLAGNTADDTAGGLNVDKSPPLVTATASPPSVGGWNNSDVTVAFSAIDALSGIDGPDHVTVLLSAEGVGLSASHGFTDRAGNSAATAIEGINIDKTNPTLSFGTPTPEANPAGWNNTDVSIGFSTDDGLSGVASVLPQSPLVLSAEGSAVTGSVSVTDAAGNTAVFTSPAANIDKTQPTLSFEAPIPAANPAGWNNTDVAIAFSTDDNLSGIADVTPQSPVVLSAEGSGVTAPVSVTDAAGNTAVFTSPAVNIDKTQPTLSFEAPIPAANPAGWNNTDVVIAFSTDDNLSGIADVMPQSPLMLSAEGSGVVALVSVSDAAGNTAVFTSPAVNIDKTAPSLSCSAAPSVLWPANHKLVPVTVDVTFTDTLSGPATFELSAAASSEPDTGLSGGDKPEDIQGFAIGAGSTSGALRAERAGNGPGRTYSLGYTGWDSADNSATCGTDVSVPHDQGKKSGKEE